MTEIYITSDSHYQHTNICRGTTSWTDKERTRDFPTLESMNNALVDGINEIVRADDILYHLGDWSFGGVDKIREFREKINCTNIILILGNHDHHIAKDPCSYMGVKTFGLNKACFREIEHYKEIKEKGYPIFCLFHYPIQEWNHKWQGAWHLHGHSHCRNGVVTAKGRVDVSPEGNNFKPYHIEELHKILQRSVTDETA